MDNLKRALMGKKVIIKNNSHLVGGLPGGCVPLKGPVTLLRMRETYELRMKIQKIIFIRTKCP